MINESIAHATHARARIDAALSELGGGSRRLRSPGAGGRRRGAVRGPLGAGVGGVRPSRVWHE